MYELLFNLTTTESIILMFQILINGDLGIVIAVVVVILSLIHI